MSSIGTQRRRHHIDDIIRVVKVFFFNILNIYFQDTTRFFDIRPYRLRNNYTNTLIERFGF